ncbi:MAG: glycosyltransferase [Bacteroidales bacterium]|nr:glycosyltransferase [Bacteroidales bacterium]
MKIFLALPVMNESSNLPDLIGCLEDQKFADSKLFVCVNQPEAWWNDQERKHICEDNQKSLRLLNKHHAIPLEVLDRSSMGKGWRGKHHGVGWARKIAMDAINKVAEPEDLIVSIDADTFYPPEYLESLRKLFVDKPAKIAVSNPYYHKLSGDEDQDRAMLRYEFYMRNYAINMMLIDSPYCFTALGSAMTIPVWAYRKVGGITPHKSGEDFYFLQKLRKSGELMLYNGVKVYPSGRKSDRVFFGTGPAIIKGLQGEWDSYPIYHHKLFEDVGITYASFERLFTKDIPTPMTGFLQATFRKNAVWDDLRMNVSSADKFVRACITKVDALRILQYLKMEQSQLKRSDEDCLTENLKYFSKRTGFDIILPSGISFQKAEIQMLDELRNDLMYLESLLQQRLA